MRGLCLEAFVEMDRRMRVFFQYLLVFWDEEGWVEISVREEGQIVGIEHMVMGFDKIGVGDSGELLYAWDSLSLEQFGLDCIIDSCLVELPRLLVLFHEIAHHINRTSCKPIPPHHFFKVFFSHSGFHNHGHVHVHKLLIVLEKVGFPA